MDANRIKYRLITLWFKKKYIIQGLFVFVLITFVLFYNSSQRYQFLLKAANNGVNRLSYSFFTLLFLSVFIAFLVALFFIKPFKKCSDLNSVLNNTIDTGTTIETLLQFYPFGSALVNRQTGYVTRANAVFCEILGYTQQEIKEGRCIVILPPADSSFDSNKNTSKYATQIVSKSGNTLEINITSAPLVGRNEKPYTHLIFIEPINSENTRDRLIEKKESTTQSLIDIIEDIVWEYDVESSKLTFSNDTIESILGYSVTECLEKTDFWKDVIHHHDLECVMYKMHQALKNTIPHQIEFRMVTKNGKTVWMKNVFYCEKENSTSIKGIMTPISKTKEIEKELKKTIQLVTEQNNKLLNFSYIVSHNLRSHTSNIESISNVIASTNSVEEQVQMIQLLKSASNSLNQTVHDLNNVVNVKSKINLVSKSLNLNHYIQETEKMLADQIESNGATIVNLIPSDVMVNYNPACLESALYNLFSNSLRFKHPDRKPIITIKCTSDESTNKIEISDNGIGIDLAKNADKIFRMYHTFHKNIKSKGLGLFITKTQIEALGGTISVESTVNIGTTFKLTFS